MNVCIRCRTEVTDEISNDDYAYYCPEHCEDLYEFETIEVCCKCKQEVLNDDVIFRTEHNDSDDIMCISCAESSLVEGEYIDDVQGNAWTKCVWCEQIFPENELRREESMGFLCDSCVQGILSRGESLCLVYGD